MPNDLTSFPPGSFKRAFVLNIPAIEEAYTRAMQAKKGTQTMTLIHQCDRCGYQGRVTQTPDAFLCEACDELYLSQRRAEEICPTCGHEGITETGLCGACSQSPEIMPQPDC